jgi:chromatin segregation and condensation protein Rec8/ScpA/Scc1 (kleisin family)
MRRRGYIDFTASGIALLSSATIYRMKTELILKLEEPPMPPPPKIAEVLPPPIQLPIRYEYTTTSIEQLIKMLDEALKAEPTLLKSRLKPITPAPPVLQQLDQFIVEIEEHIERMYTKIAEMAVKENLVSFSKLITGLKRLEIVRVFLIILFLACRGKINLWQEQEFGEIYISLPGGSPGGSQAVGIV